MARVNTARSFRMAAAKIRRCAKGLDETFPSGLRLIGEEIMTDVKATRPGYGVPRDLGNLAGSGKVEGGGRGKQAHVTLSFGGAAAPYALYQHERTDLRHDDGEARYLVRGTERWKPDGSSAVDAMKANAEAAIRAAAR